MEYRRLGASGLSVPVLSLGTGTFGGKGDFFAAWGNTDATEARRLLDVCLDYGLNMFDSADGYSKGEAEAVLGATWKDKIGGRLQGLADLAGDLRPVCIDGRLHAWEWRAGPDGAIRKTDAVDHAFAHDLVGCQDAAWDVAGAAVEFQLKAAETETLARRVAVSPTAASLFEGLYCAFQAGVWTMSADSQQAEAAARAREQASRYVEALRSWAQDR